MYNISSFSHTKTARFGSGATILRSRDAALSDEQILAAAPSVFAQDKHASRTERYTYVPTSEVLKGLRAEGFAPYEVRQGGSRDDEKRGFTKHMIRLRHEGAINLVGGDSMRELILLNAHDGTSSYQLMSGLFRIVCCNGLITCEGGEMLRIPHKGDIISNVIEGSFQIIDNNEQVQERVESMRAVTLSNGEQEAFAHAALALRFDDKNEDGTPKAAPIEPRQINTTRREADKGADMWRTFNRVQENLITGGQGYTHRAANGQRSHRHTRPVQSIDGNVTLNRALWVLATKMQELKAMH